jgi:hypothetical protein
MWWHWKEKTTRSSLSCSQQLVIQSYIGWLQSTLHHLFPRSPLIKFHLFKPRLHKWHLQVLHVKSVSIADCSCLPNLISKFESTNKT